MNTKTPRTWRDAIVLTLVAFVFISVTGWLIASPGDEIRQALGAQPTQVSAQRFLDAFASVMVGTEQKDSAAYITAATEMRPDLKAQITALASEITNDGEGATDGSANQVSGNHRLCWVCCSGQSLHLPCRIARQKVQHGLCRKGKCHH